MPPPQQPPYPGPYGQQPAQAAPGPYGPPYPQQAPYPQQQPYPAPQPYPAQQPYQGGQPYPAPQPYPPQTPYPAWGGPPMGPPPKKRRTGLVLGIVGGVVTALVAGFVVLGAALDSGFPAAEHELALPHSLLGTEYTLAEDLSGTKGKEVEDEADGAWGVKDVHAVVGRYSPPGDDSRAVLLVSGMYGRFKNTGSIRRNMLKGAAEAEGVTVERPARDVTPSGADTPVSCQVLSQKTAAATLTYGVCAWADGNTAAVVGEVDGSVRDPADVDLADAARTTVRIRSEMLRPAG
ncbi:hypothetical protein ACH4NF_28275 [Streptomyces sp. NPDC017248]|uniref:hypothetical protein n=1 Tax=unclassified Streptomyces TaxID=2593676 RepID=UPI0037A835CF